MAEKKTGGTKPGKLIPNYVTLGLCNKRTKPLRRFPNQNNIDPLPLLDENVNLLYLKFQ